MNYDNNINLSYIETIENLTVYLRNSGLMLSPDDVAIVKKWENAGIPFKNVAKVLITEIDEFKKRYRGKKEIPHTLKYFLPQIEKKMIVLSRKESSNLSKSPCSVTKSKTRKIIKKFDLLIKKAKEHFFKMENLNEELYKKIKNIYAELMILRENLINENLSDISVNSMIISLNQQMLDALKNTLDKSLLNKIMEESEAAAMIKYNGLGENAFNELKKQIFEDILLEKTGLFRIEI